MVTNDGKTKVNVLLFLFVSHRSYIEVFSLSFSSGLSQTSFQALPTGIIPFLWIKMIQY
jgi:hypothetical protein